MTDPIQPIRDLVGGNLSDVELAQKLQITPSTLSHWRSRGIPKALACVLPFVNSPRSASTSGYVAEVREDAATYRTNPAHAPVSDRRLASLIAWIVETWEAATEFERGGWYARFVAAFPEARGGQAALRRVVAALGWRVIEGGADGLKRGTKANIPPENWSKLVQVLQ